MARGAPATMPGLLPRIGCLIVLAALLAARAPEAQAADRCPPGAAGTAALGEIDPELRLHWIDDHLSRTAHRARVWTWSWGTGIVVATVANLVPLAFVSPDQRVDWYTGAATTIVGIVPLLIAPLDVVDDSRALRARLAARTPADDVCLLLADAELKLVRDAKNQADGKRWWLHVGNVVLNTGVGLFLALGYHHWKAGVFNAVVGLGDRRGHHPHPADLEHRRPAHLPERIARRDQVRHVQLSDEFLNARPRPVEVPTREGLGPVEVRSVAEGAHVGQEAPDGVAHRTALPGRAMSAGWTARRVSAGGRRICAARRAVARASSALSEPQPMTRRASSAAAVDDAAEELVEVEAGAARPPRAPRARGARPAG